MTQVIEFLVLSANPANRQYRIEYRLEPDGLTYSRWVSYNLGTLAVNLRYRGVLRDYSSLENVSFIG
jgi:hypothetical protein